MEQYTIKRMTRDDVENIMQIEESAYGEHHWSKDSFYSELGNNLAYYYVAMDTSGNYCGYAGSWHILEEAHITTIAVSPNHRRKHIAESLLCTIIDDCYKDGIKYITLEVRVSNEPAIKLYEKYGFTSFGVRKGYYQNNNEDALIMWTENIFWDKFKLKYDENKQKLRELFV